MLIEESFSRDPIVALSAHLHARDLSHSHFYTITTITSTTKQLNAEDGEVNTHLFNGVHFAFHNFVLAAFLLDS